jgi:hypothetical protein
LASAFPRRAGIDYSYFTLPLDPTVECPDRSITLASQPIRQKNAANQKIVEAKCGDDGTKLAFGWHKLAFSGRKIEFLLILGDCS